jgi:hypothetical protein
LRSAERLCIAGAAAHLLVALLTALAAAGIHKLAGLTITRQTSLAFGPFSRALTTRRFLGAGLLASS